MAPPGQARPLDTLIFGRPDAHFFDDLDDDVAIAIETAENRLRAAGARVVPLTLPALSDLDAAFGAYLSAELVAYLGAGRVSANLARMDPVVSARIAPGLTLAAEAFIRLRGRFASLASRADLALAGVDAVLTPTCPRVAPPIADYRSPEAAAAWSRDALRFTRPGNLFGLCGVSLPVHAPPCTLPVGLQLLGRAGGERDLLAVAAVVEAALRR